MHILLLDTFFYHNRYFYLTIMWTIFKNFFIFCYVATYIGTWNIVRIEERWVVNWFFQKYFFLFIRCRCRLVGIQINQNMFLSLRLSASTSVSFRECGNQSLLWKINVHFELSLNTLLTRVYIINVNMLM